MFKPVEFDPATFREIYPEFANASDARLEFMFDEALLLVDNTKATIITEYRERRILLYLLVAHMAELAGLSSSAGDSGASSGLVGRLSSATEGTVSVSADMPGTTGRSAWYMQTSYGAKFWALTAPYRTFRYKPGRSPSEYPGDYYTRWGWRYAKK